jgi:hypothetical protein
VNDAKHLFRPFKSQSGKRIEWKEEGFSSPCDSLFFPMIFLQWRCVCVAVDAFLFYPCIVLRRILISFLDRVRVCSFVLGCLTASSSIFLPSSASLPPPFLSSLYYLEGPVHYTHSIYNALGCVCGSYLLWLERNDLIVKDAPRDACLEGV